ncbi:MAG: homocysteine S-methyltransferase family protein [Candidatus Levybacteria bacterium]|nr:homocysteine S-methyltransferase family protein [Candidatus Levybacteria bacterium]
MGGNASSVSRWVEDGALLIGGCCGTNPSYIKIIVNTLKEKRHH